MDGNIHAGSYHIFAGKDASKGLGLSSTRAEDAVPDWSTLSAEALTTLDGWYAFFQ
jgi:membrane-associated progesterone receptor component